MTTDDSTYVPEHERAAEALEDKLRAWAHGSLPCQAAVQFVIATGTDLTAMVRETGDRAYLDLFDMTAEQWSERTGWMSGGQRATWDLVRSILEGELHDTFWRLDGSRKQQLLMALHANSV